MDLTQKFIEEIDVEEWFALELNNLPQNIAEIILKDIASVAKVLPILNGYSQIIYGVVYDHNVFYFIDYLKQEEERLLIIDITFVESDEYLDAINENNTIKYYYGTIKKRNED